MVDKKLVELKESTALRLSQIDVDSYNLSDADKRLESYVKSCIANHVA